jgi:hypothetical protein
VFGKNAIAIVKQVFVSLLEPDGLTQLLQCPSGTGMGGDVAMDQATAAVLDHDKHVQQTKGRRHRHEEIAGSNPLGMKAQEGRPPQITPRTTSRTPGKILVHGSRRLGSAFQSELSASPLYRDTIMVIP